MTRIVVAAFAAFIAFCLSSIAFAQTDTTSGIQPHTEIQPQSVTQSGGFTYSIPIEIPEFRGIEPNIGLRYNSSQKSRSNARDFIGIGWRLGGFSEIERVSQKLGTPTFKNADDIFLLDGQPLMACADTNATQPYTGTYPERFKTDQQSASCLSEGNFSTMRESDRKILRDVDTNTWTVFSKDGTRHIYKSMFFLANTNVAWESNEGKYLRSKWLLTEIRNAQATESVVTFRYHFDADRGYAHRPRDVRYHGYRIIFGYQTRSTPLAQWASGTGLLVQQFHRLISIRVYDNNGSTNIAATGLSYTSSSEAGSSLLTKVEHFGKDFVVSNNAITGGSRLPSYDMTYETDQFGLNKQTYSGVPFSNAGSTWDTNRDGSEDLHFKSVRHGLVSCYNGPEADERIVSGPLQPGGNFRVGEDRSLTSYIPTPASSIDLRRIRLEAGSKEFHYLRGRSTVRHHRTGDESDYYYTTGYLAVLKPDGSVLTEYKGQENYSGQDSPAGTGGGLSPGVLGNFDLDPETDMSRFEIQNNQLVAKSFAVGSFLFDLDGDGMHESIHGDLIGKKDGTYQWNLYDPKFATSPDFDKSWIPNPAADLVPTNLGPGQIRYIPGDVNGDGKDDMIIHSNSEIWVSLSTGNGFAARTLWMSSVGVNGQETISVRDVNGDGLGDLLLDKASTTRLISCSSTSPEMYVGGQARVFISDGQSFKQPVTISARTIPNTILTGDFDGDGALDFASSGANGSISFGTSSRPNLMKTMKDPQGGVTHVTYQSIAHANTDTHFREPGSRQIVTQIRKTNGRGAERIYKYSYRDSNYDYYLRQPLGFRTVTTTLPRIGGESADPQIVTIYLNNSYGEAGLVKSRTFMRGGKTWQKEIYDYSLSTSGNGPYVVRKTSKRHSELYGSNTLLETQMTFAWSVFGEPRRITHHGRTVNGANATAADDVTTVWEYAENRDKYIVAKPRRKSIQAKISTSVDASSALSIQFYWYDGRTRSTGTPPIHGNLTKVNEWRGDPASLSSRSVAYYTYDKYGNLVSEADAVGHTTRHEYDGAKHLFPTRTINAKNHVTEYVWSSVCRDVTLEKDPNGQLTTTTFDVFCRPLVTSYPDGNISENLYVDFGDPNKQHIRNRTLSGSSASGRKRINLREFFDGFGQVYKKSRSGNTANENDRIVTFFEFDARGNTVSESIPISWADAADNAAGKNQKTRFQYDTLGRPLRTTLPDGQYTQTFHSTRRRAHNGWPTMDAIQTDTRGIGCYDGDSATPCERRIDVFDTRGNHTISYQHDPDKIANGTSATWHATHYTYDLLGRLTRIKDPVGATWNYTYDTYGNRTRADDPGLGTWTMAYDARNLLTEQTDAKGQKIRFTYDQLGRQLTKTVLRANGSQESKTTSTYDQARTGRYNTGHLTKIERGSHAITYDYSQGGHLWFEKHFLPERTYSIQNSYFAGVRDNIRLPDNPNSNGADWVGTHDFDSAGRLTKIAGKIDAITYNLRGQPTKYTFDSGATETLTYNAQRGWLESSRSHGAGNINLGVTSYEYFADGRAKRMYTNEAWGRFNYTYDYAGRLIEADADDNSYDQTFTYDAGGRMRNNSNLGAYDYTNFPRHAPWRVNGENFEYDANGNMTRGLGGKTMTYDAENRPVTVTFNGRTTRYEYAADGTRLKKIENDNIPAERSETLYFNVVEIRNFMNRGGAEQVITYPHPNLRLVNGVPSYIHTDRLGSTRRITGADGAQSEQRNYRPFGEELGNSVQDASAIETKGFIGERYDAGAGLQYLNARYYDPKLAMFIQPDWFEVMEPGVGTNRYSYSANDPINFSDPNGNLFSEGDFLGRGGAFDRATGGLISHISDSFSGDRERVQRAELYNDLARTDLYEGGYNQFVGVFSLASEAAERATSDRLSLTRINEDGTFTGHCTICFATEFIFGAYGARKLTREAIERFSKKLTTALDIRPHGNKKLSPRRQVIYNLLDINDGSIQKIGIAGKEELSKRYNPSTLRDRQVVLVRVQEVRFRAVALGYEKAAIAGYRLANGGAYPPQQFNFPR